MKWAGAFIGVGLHPLAVVHSSPPYMHYTSSMPYSVFNRRVTFVRTYDELLNRLVQFLDALASLESMSESDSLRFLVQQNTALFSTFLRPFVRSSFRHRRDISTFLDNLMV